MNNYLLGEGGREGKGRRKRREREGEDRKREKEGRKETARRLEGGRHSKPREQSPQH